MTKVWGDEREYAKIPTRASANPALFSLVEVEIRLYDAFFGVTPQVEAELLEEALRSAVFAEDVGGDATQALGSAGLEELL